MGVAETDPLSQLSLPPGFRFFPTDEELLVQYLCRKVAGHHFSLQIIAEIDLYKFDPWVLPSKAIFGEKEWYFFSPRDRKYPNGSRPNRVAGTGYWKATGTDKIITTEGRKVGIKKALVFYVGKAPKGTKTNWIMHEYRLFEPSRKAGSSKLDDWVLCRIYKKSSGSNGQKAAMMMSTSTSRDQQYSNGSASSTTSSSHGLDDVLESLPSIDERFFSLPRVASLKNLGLDQNNNNNHQAHGGEDRLASLLNLGSGNFDWATLAGFNSLPELAPSSGAQTQAQGEGFGNCGADVYVPSVPALRHVDSQAKRVGYGLMDDEVQSGLRTQQRIENSGFFQQNSGGLTQGLASNSVDAYGFRYPTHSVGFGFGR